MSSHSSSCVRPAAHMLQKELDHLRQTQMCWDDLCASRDFGVSTQPKPSYHTQIKCSGAQQGWGCPGGRLAPAWWGYNVISGDFCWWTSDCPHVPQQHREQLCEEVTEHHREGSPGSATFTGSLSTIPSAGWITAWKGMAGHGIWPRHARLIAMLTCGYKRVSVQRNALARWHCTPVPPYSSD